MKDMTKPFTVRGVDEIQLDLWRVYGTDRATLIWNSLSSAYDRLLFAHNHLQLLRKVAKPAVERGLETFGFLESLDDDEDTEALFSQSMHQVKMYVTDCIQHMHAVGDTVALAIYFFIDVPKDKQLEKKKISLFEVRRLLDENLTLPGAAVFLALLKKLTAPESYVYLADMNNHAKHRSIVQPSVTLPFNSEISQEEHEDSLIFSMVEMSNPPQPLRNRGAIAVHGRHPILPFIEAELARIWDIYGEIRHEFKKQARLAPSSAAYAAVHEG